MRTATIADGDIITYPEEICFAFNPNFIKVKNASIDGDTPINISCGGFTFIDTREDRNSELLYDLSEYIKVFFNDLSFPLSSKNIHVNYQDDDIFNFDITCIWGAMNIGEVFNPSRKVVWFKNFPFTFSMFVGSGATIRKRYDKNKYTSASIGTGLVHIDPNTLFPNAKEFGVIRLDEEIPFSTFEYTFDNTFRPVGDGTIINRLVIDECDKGCYLRWIDRHGFYQYWLFKEGDNVSQSSSAGESIYQDYSDDMYWYSGVSRFQMKSSERSIRSCAPLIDQDTFKMLEGLHSSPIVDLWWDGKWVPVNIANSTTTNTGEHLQDFEIEITLPELITQSL